MIGLYYADWFEDYTAQIASAVSDHDSYDVQVVVRDSSLHFRGTPAEVEAQRDKLRTRINGLTILAGRYSSPRTYLDVYKEFAGRSGERYDYFHIQQSGDPRFLGVAVRLPTVVTLHEPAPREGVTRGGGIRGLSNSVVQRLYRLFADAIVVHTQSGFESLSPRERRKAVVIPKGIEMLSLPQNAGDGSKTILFFGRAAKYKGLDTLVSAMDEVWKIEPAARLHILASGGDPECVSDFADSRISATWTGYSNEELTDALAKARVICLPYTSVSGTAVGVQAYGSGRPIVASNLEGLRELVPSQELLVEPGNSADLARALLLALRGDYSVTEVAANRTMPAIADAHIAVYESIGRVHRAPSMMTTRNEPSF